MTPTIGGPATVGEPVRTLRGRHVLSMAQFGRTELEELFALTRSVDAAARAGTLGSPLAGRIMISAFFDASTRTRLSHEAAMLRLGGTVTGFSDIEVTRAGSRTGESLPDLFRMLAGYGDVIVTRHPDAGVAAVAAETAPGTLVVNGGDGLGEHPTQTMTDLYSIWERFGRIDGLRIGVVNDLRMRCVRSLLRGLRNFDCTVCAVPAPGKDLDDALLDECDRDGPPIEIRDDVRDLLADVDAVYSSPTILDDPGPVRRARDVLPGDTPLDADLLDRHGAEHLAVFHPLPRTDELDTSVDPTDRNGYWRQAENGVPLRMALLLSLLGADG